MLSIPQFPKVVQEVELVITQEHQVSFMEVRVSKDSIGLAQATMGKVRLMKEENHFSTIGHQYLTPL
jgi:hypothetical protein